MIIGDGCYSNILVEDQIQQNILIEISDGVFHPLLIATSNGFSINPYFHDEPRPTPTPAPSPTPSPVESPTPTPSPTPSPVESPTPSPTPSPSPTTTATPSPSPTETVTETITPSRTETVTVTISPSPTETSTPSHTPTPTRTPGVVVCLPTTNTVSVNDGFILLNNRPYDVDIQFGMYEGEYEFTVPEEYPIGFVTSVMNVIIHSGTHVKTISINGTDVHMHHGDVRIEVLKDFGVISFVIDGYTGGENKLKYANYCNTLPGDIVENGMMSDTYSESLFSGSQSLVIRCVVRDGNEYKDGTMYAFTRKPINNATFAVYMNLETYYCIGQGHASNTYLTSDNTTHIIPWGYMYTLIVSLEDTPHDIKLIYEDKENVLWFVDTDTDFSNIIASEAIMMMPTENVSVFSPDAWIHVTPRRRFNPIIMRPQSIAYSTLIEGHLPLNIEEPNVAFEVRYNDYAYHTVVYATVKNDGQYIIELGDIMTVVDGSNQVRGVSSTVVEYNGIPMFAIQVYSNVSGGSFENVSFKFLKHRSSVQMISNRLYDLDMVLINGTQITDDATAMYSQDAPLVFNFGLIERKVSGPYDWVSVNVTTDDMSFLNVFGSFINDITAIRSKTSIIIKSGGMWIGTIGDIHTNEFYIIKTNESAEYNWKFEGKFMETIQQPIIQNGYNWISYPLNYDSSTSKFVSSYIDGFDDKVSEIMSQNGILIRSGDGTWYGNMTQFIPNDGYILNVKNMTSSTVMSYPNSSLDYVKVNNDVISGYYILSVVDVPFVYDRIQFNIINDTRAVLGVTIGDIQYTVYFDTDMSTVELNTWKDNSFTSIAPTDVEGVFVTPLISSTTLDVIEISKVKMVSSYSLEMFNGEYILTLNGYLDFFGRIGTPDPMTNSVGDASWMSTISRKVFQFSGSKGDGTITLPETPTPTVVSSIIYGTSAPLLQSIVRGDTIEVFINTFGQTSGVGGFEIPVGSGTNIIGTPVMNQELEGYVNGAFIITNSTSKVIGMQMSAVPIEVRADTATLFLTIPIGVASIGTIEWSNVILTDKSAVELDMTSIRYMPTPTPTSSIVSPTPTPTPTVVSSIIYGTSAPLLQSIVRGDTIEVFINTFGQTSGVGGFEIPVGSGTNIIGTPVMNQELEGYVNGAFIITNSTSKVIGMQMSAAPIEVRADTATLFLTIPIGVASIGTIEWSNVILTDKSAVELDMTSIRLALRQLIYSQQSDIIGDVNGDGVCNIIDIQMTIHEIFNVGSLTPGQRARANLNGDTYVNIIDVQRMIHINFGTYVTPSPTPTNNEIENVFRKVLDDGFEMHANDELSILYFTRNGDILIEITPELGIEESIITIPDSYGKMVLTHDWNILYPKTKNIDLSMMDLRFMYKGNEQGLIVPMLSNAMMRAGISASLYFSESGSHKQAFWAITTNVDDGVKFWFREDLTMEWISQLQIGAMTLAGYRTIVTKIEVDDDR
jgi:hypothetical protein